MQNNKNFVKLNGVVEKVLPNLSFRVKLDKQDREILAYLSGKMRKFRIKVLVGDRVVLELPSEDASRGRIVYRNG